MEKKSTVLDLDSLNAIIILSLFEVLKSSVRTDRLLKTDVRMSDLWPLC